MQVRIFEASDMASGLKMVRQELGADALILSTRTVKNGKLGILGKSIFEITAAIDTPWPREKKSSQATVYQEPAIPQTIQAGSSINCTVGDSPDTYEAFRSSSPSRSAHGHDRLAAEQNSAHENDIRLEIDELKNLVKNLAGTIALINQPKDEPQASLSPTSEPQTRLQNRLQAMRPPADHLIEYLLDYGIDLETAKTMTEFARESLTGPELEDPEIFHAFSRKTIQDLIAVNPPDFSHSGSQYRLALIGPTGVGKTTTLAKLAAHYLSRFSHSIALITIDTYRIAAVEQLKVYGEIMHLPVEVVITPEQLDQALIRHQDKELVLIDTAGRSPKDSLCIEELATFLRPELGIDKHLVLSATTRETELFDIIKRFDRLGIDRTIFTKVDECSHLGALLNIQIRSGKPLSYVTNGQRVPEDLLQITKENVAELIMSKHEGILHD